MSISRRAAISLASAFAVSTVETNLASAMQRGSVPQPRIHMPGQSAQRFLVQLIHHDEAGHQPHKAILSIASPDTAWFAKDTMDETTYRMTNHSYRMRGWRLKRVSVFKTGRGPCFSAIWQLASGPEWHTRHGMSQADFDAANKDYAARGMRLVHLDARSHYAAIWERGDASTQQVFSSLSTADYDRTSAELAGQGYRPMRLSLRAEGAAPRLAAIFEKASGVEWQARHSMNGSDLHRAEIQANANGLRMIDAAGHMVGGKPVFTGVWQKA
ncbi:MAG: hypothetical protein JOZ72_08315 [Alphaproteobacteria bacterium]|nr:hypothetical protein [Alphaproteobacteria bacterium]